MPLFIPKFPLFLSDHGKYIYVNNDDFANAIQDACKYLDDPKCNNLAHYVFQLFRNNFVQGLQPCVEELEENVKTYNQTRSLDALQKVRNVL